MRAEISDAPERLTRKRHNRNVSHTLICLAIGSLVTIGAVGLVNRATSTESTYKQPMSHPGSDDELTHASYMPPSRDLDSSWLRASSEIRPPSDTNRQTAFNDQNFTPRGADNVIAFPAIAYIPSRDEPSNKAKLTIVRQSPSMKDRACWPYRQGSIERRNCRLSVGLKHRD
jgi:hypothetical protein